MNKRRSQKIKGFSLIELMVSMGILTVLMLMMTALLDQVQKSWRYSESRISQFREARVAFDLITKKIGQASLNTYWDLKDDDDDGLVDGYYKTSELHFITLDASTLKGGGEQEGVGHAVFFQAPLGFSTDYRNLNNLFNGRGYFASFGSDRLYRPSFIDSSPRYRFRIMEFRPPAESNQVFEDGKEEREEDEPQEFTEWYTQSLSVGKGNFESHLNPLADNIIALVISPRDALESSSGSRDQTYSEIAPDYKFDSNSDDPSFEGYSQQVPPLLRITMVAIDEASAVRLEDGTKMPDDLRSATSGLFKSTRQYPEDIKKLAETLNEKKINHKIFSSLVMLRSSKWGT
ncbi:MAG: Verru_Chthon cassette protein C [Verrucomicrobiales bacterium]|nr:Verru_Chthon cassette protein C [Verrucomicrobiales bacterium]